MTLAMPPLTIRPATSDDCTAIAAIYAPAVLAGTTSFELEPPDAAEMRRRMRALVDGGFPYLAAERGGTVVGYAYAGPYRTRPAYRYTVENSVYVAPQAQRGGIGRTLMTALIEASAARGFRQMLAVIGDSPNQPGSVGLHKACGFVEVGRLPEVGYKFGRWLDTLIMQRALGSGSKTAP